MHDHGNLSPDKPTRRLRFSVGAVLIWTAIVCLAISNVMLSRKVESITQDVQSKRPLSVQDVADQFEKQTTQVPITTTVKDVRYSEEKDAFQVEFTWADSNTNKEWWASVTLESDEFGRYQGKIRKGSFVRPLGYQYGFAVVVESPSAFERRNDDP